MTLNTVLLSLQTLLCENPVNNEPGLENIEITDPRAVSYNNLITYYNFEVAMLRIFMKTPVSFEGFRNDCVKEFFKNYEEIKNKLQALVTSEYNNKEYTSKFFGMHCRMEYTQLISYFENEYKYLLNDYEHILAEQERENAGGKDGDEGGAGESGGIENSLGADGDSKNKDYKIKRKCPTETAKSFNEGHIEQGVDGKFWQVKLYLFDG